MSAVAIDATHAAGELSLRVSFATPDRGIAVLFGPSGAGKSLTLALIAGLRRPESGTIAIRGRRVEDVGSGLHVPSRERRLGMVFQDSLLLPHLTALDNVALAVRGPRRRRLRRERARAVLDEVGAAHLAGSDPARLSGGERQRVAFARALAGDPDLLLLDEPFSALDRPVRGELRALVRSMVEVHGTPALFVTHDHDEAAELADFTVDFEIGRALEARPGSPRIGVGRQ